MAAPVAVRTACAAPLTTLVPKNTNASRSPSDGRVTSPSLRDLERRSGLAGQGRLVDVEVVGLDEPSVRRDDVAGVEDDEVAAHEIVHRDVLLGAVADDRGLQRQSGLQRGDRALRAGLLDEAEAADSDDDDQDDARVDLVAREDGDDARDDEQQHERARELAEEDGQASPTPALLDLIRTISQQTLGGLR